MFGGIAWKRFIVEAPINLAFLIGMSGLMKVELSRQDRCELSDFKFESISNGAASSWVERLSSPGTHVIVMVLPVGWVGEWHENPKPQWIVLPTAQLEKFRKAALFSMIG